MGANAADSRRDQADAHNDVGFSPCFDDDGKVVGVTVQLNQIGFTLVLARVQNIRGSMLDGALFRPKELAFEGPRSRVILAFGGLGWDSGPQMRLTWTPKSASLT